MKRPGIDTVLFTAAALAAALAVPGQQGEQWHDNERQHRSGDPALNVRRSERFRLPWGRGAAARPEENADFAQVSESLVQANLQMLEQVWRRYHAPPPHGLGFHAPIRSLRPELRLMGPYRANLVLNNTGIWAGGAWGSCDEWGLPLFALPPSYLRTDPPSGATPHEYGHTVLINAGGFNDTPYDGMWHEATANWLQLQFNNSYPGPGGVGMQPFLSLPHGRNYYDAWQIWEALREDPRYGPAFISRVWTEGRGSKDKGAEYILNAIARLDTSGSPDRAAAIRELLGRVAARSVTWDYQRQPYFQLQSPRTMDPFSEMYRRAYTELERVPGSRTWFQVPFAHAPMQGGYNVVPIALPGKGAAPYPVGVHLRPRWDATRGSDWRATLVAVSDRGDARYSAMWNGGLNRITLSRDENRLYLVVAATPDLIPFEGFSRPLIADLPLQPQAYEVAFVGTRATAYESRPRRPEGIAGQRHPNGGGFVAATAHVDRTAFVGPNALVLGEARVTDRARVEDFAVVMDEAEVSGDARVSGHALVRERARVADRGKVRDWATVQGAWRVYEDGRALERAYLLDRGQLHGHATIKGNVPDYGGADVKGHAIKEGDCANGVSIDRQVLMCWVWGFDQEYADKQPDTGGLYAHYTFRRASPIYALDRFGVMHGTLRGRPGTVNTNLPGGPGALAVDGKTQYVELKRDTVDFASTTIALRVRPDAAATGQELLYAGDGAGRYLSLRTRDPHTGTLTLVFTTNGRAGERRVAAPRSLRAGRWTHVAVTFDGRSATIYVDGAAAASAPLPGGPDQVLGPNTLDGRTAVYLGRGAAGGHFGGLVTDFRVTVRPQDARSVEAMASEAVPSERPGAVVARPAGRRTPVRAAFLLPPKADPAGRAVMSAVPQGAAAGVEYAFTCTRGRGPSSGWISSHWWAAPALEPGQYTYVVRVRARDGRVSVSGPAVAAVPAPAAAPPAAAFDRGPAGVADGAIEMAARATPAAAADLVEYRFVRSDGKASPWQASRTLADRGLRPGARYRYRVQARYGGKRAGALSAARVAMAVDETPPARYVLGEWQTLPYATTRNTIAMRAMSVTGQDGCPRIEQDPVEYLFECTAGGGPSSGWIGSPFWETPPLADGAYAYRFRMRDTSPRRNTTGPSSVESAAVTPLTGYHAVDMAAVLASTEGALVQFEGTVSRVDPEGYLVESGRDGVRVVPRTVRGAGDPALASRQVVVRGCVWAVSGQKRVVWADVVPR